MSARCRLIWQLTFADRSRHEEDRARRDLRERMPERFRSLRCREHGVRSKLRIASMRRGPGGISIGRSATTRSDVEPSFASVIKEHLDLKRRNVARVRSDPVGDRTSDDLDSEPAAASAANDPLLGAFEYEQSLWGRAREFDWGD